MVPRQNGFHRLALPDTRGRTRGGLVSPTLFNMVVDNVIRTWLSMTVEDHRVAQDGLKETIGRYVGVFYADDGMVGSRDLDWQPHALNVLVSLCRRYDLAAIVAKSCTVTCHPRELRVGVSEEAMEMNCTGWKTRIE